MNSITYGIGGELSDHPNGNIVERIIDNGDGTGTRTTYDEHGNETSVEKLDDLPIVEPEPVIVEPTAPLDAFAAKLRAELPVATTLTKLRAVLSDALDELG